ncbi:malonyl-CoA-acyl carrier protein transacylase, mitochondrial [Patella vulgata]|uniref:malonyl-CoA-acyl carrier protein transacylase, mitochondrial n=1 Tax=Patella vulgata TaxID=6465 RepID=UPI0021800843|nr:malonyl-CoA-acyl carrier protein transacylase, mitochondrial [Patella vulgata]
MCNNKLQNMLFNIATTRSRLILKKYLQVQWKREICKTSMLYSEGNLQNIESETGKRIPRRILKRIEARGLTEDDVIQGSHQPVNKGTGILMGSSDNLKVLVDDMVKEGVTGTHNESEFPSDKIDYTEIKKTRDQTITAFRPKTNPLDTSLILFPGQGSQFVGMGKKLLAYNGVKDLFEMASDVLEYDLLDICLNGPKSQLDKTVVCQPAVFVTSMAAVEKLHELHPQVMKNCTGTAGFSVGEYSSLVFSGMLTFRDAVRVVKVRAEAMQRASEIIPSGMMTVFVGHNSKLNFAMLAAREYCSQKLHIREPVCCIANYLYSDCKVIAGNEEALQFIEDNKQDFNIKRTKRLPVSGAFHTQLMESACEPVVRALKNVEIKKPLFRVHSNVTTKRYHTDSEVVKLLRQQIIKPVKWEQILHTLYSRPQGEHFPNTYEVGPGKQMGTLLKIVNSKAHQSYTNIDV